LDDAVSVTKTKDDTYILSVHIADVSHYVMEGSFLDKEAITRGTSVYMLDRVIPMLPKELSNGICSLNEGKDRLTLSVIMEIDKKGNVISSDITKGVIKVTKRMSYNIVQKLLDLDNRAEIDEDLKQYIPYINHFKLMAELAHILENKRKENGYLDLDIPESKITLDKKGKAIDVGKYEIKFSNIIIEQFMLTANETVAEKFYWLEAPFIYRVHEAPDQEKITDLNRFLYNFGYKIKGNKENVHPKAFSSILEDIKGKDEEKVISNLILRTLKVARYEAENKGHFGIAGKYYCHFTSPIRRYPDLFIHRIISKYLDNNYMVSDDYKEKHEEFAVNYAEKSSEREKIAQKAERDSVDLKKAEYMENKIGEVYNGIVSGVTNFGLFVELENTVEGLIRFENLGNEYFNYDDMHKQLIGENTGIVYKIGDKVKIQVIEANKNLRKVAFAKYSDKEQSN
jgi:ribonuclease R